ncbi:MAG: DUF177 domain-containing protein [Rhodocyclaceae bacterium]|nr:DUF177 domain-containing protein [Rhodocyclaceae bacterium]
MSRRCIISDPFRFAAEGRRQAGVVPVAELSRLVDMLAGSEGVVSFVLAGEVDGEGSPTLSLIADGVLQLRCQRCLSAMGWPVKLESELHLVRPGTPIPEDELENDEFDTIEAGADLDVLALLEEELLLAVPIAPRHESCDAPRPLGEVKKESPFAALAGLGSKSRT